MNVNFGLLPSPSEAKGRRGSVCRETGLSPIWRGGSGRCSREGDAGGDREVSHVSREGKELLLSHHIELRIDLTQFSAFIEDHYGRPEPPWEKSITLR